MGQTARVVAERTYADGLVRQCRRFAAMQASACVFGSTFLLAILATNLWYPFETLPRYDFLLIFAVVLQALLLAFRLESLREAATILVFHVLAVGMEAFKTSAAIYAWHYPEPCVVAVGGVPLFVGFMYSAVGSYIARSWRIFDLRFSTIPHMRWTLPVAAAIYVNFFTHHYTYDIRWILLLVVVALFGRCAVEGGVGRTRYRVPLLLVWISVASLVWVAENVGTYCGVWLYPFQVDGWRLVPLSKLTAWFLLVVVSFVLASVVQQPSCMALSRDTKARRLRARRE